MHFSISKGCSECLASVFFTAISDKDAVNALHVFFTLVSVKDAVNVLHVFFTSISVNM